MAESGARKPILQLLRTPFLDHEFRGVIFFMASWNFASNVAAPFITVYLLRQLGYELGTVTMLWMAGQVATALTMYLWHGGTAIHDRGGALARPALVDRGTPYRDAVPARAHARAAGQAAPAALIPIHAL